MPEIGTRSFFTIQYLDNSGEVQTVRVNGFEIVPLTLEDDLDLFGDLQTAMDAVTLGNKRQVGWGQEEVITNLRPSNHEAQVEKEILVRMVTATVEKPLSFRIPTVDFTKFNFADPPAGDTVILSGAGATAETIALVSAIEALVTNPDDPAEGVTVVGMSVV